MSRTKFQRSSGDCGLDRRPVDGLEGHYGRRQLGIIVSKGEGARVSSTGNAPADVTVAPAVIVKAPMGDHSCALHPSALAEAEHLQGAVPDKEVIGSYASVRLAFHFAGRTAEGMRVLRG